MKSRILIFFAIAFMGIAGTAKAQECESIKDPFTGKIRTVYTHVLGGAFLVFQLELEENGSAIFQMRDMDAKIIETPIPEGSPFLILLEGGEILALTLMEESKPKVGSFIGVANAGGAYTEWIQKVALTKEQIITLTQKKVTHLKYKRHDGIEFLFDCKEQKHYKMDKHIMAAAKCMTKKK